MAKRFTPALNSNQNRGGGGGENKWVVGGRTGTECNILQNSWPNVKRVVVP